MVSRQRNEFLHIAHGMIWNIASSNTYLPSWRNRLGCNTNKCVMLSIRCLIKVLFFFRFQFNVSIVVFNVNSISVLSTPWKPSSSLTTDCSSILLFSISYTFWDSISLYFSIIVSCNFYQVLCITSTIFLHTLIQEKLDLSYIGMSKCSLIYFPCFNLFLCDPCARAMAKVL
jgi:hypothetical protein